MAGWKHPILVKFNILRFHLSSMWLRAMRYNIPETTCGMGAKLMANTLLKLACAMLSLYSNRTVLFILYIYVDELLFTQHISGFLKLRQACRQKNNGALIER